MKNVPEEKILGIVIDNNLIFKSYTKTICEKANKKQCIFRNLKLTTLIQREKLKSFINKQFTYCPLIWMFSSKGY